MRKEKINDDNNNDDNTDDDNNNNNSNNDDNNGNTDNKIRILMMVIYIFVIVNNSLVLYNASLGWVCWSNITYQLRGDSTTEYNQIKKTIAWDFPQLFQIVFKNWWMCFWRSHYNKNNVHIFWSNIRFWKNYLKIRVL